MLNWANRFNIFCLLDNNNYSFEQPAFESLLAVGSVRSYTFTGKNDLQNFQAFIDENSSWLFGHFGYNAFSNAYKMENVSEGFCKGFFFEPEIILKLSNNNIEIIKSSIGHEILLQQIEETTEVFGENIIPFKPVSLLTKEKYIEQIIELQKHILRGDCYEINFCQKFYVSNATINPIEIYQKLTAVSPAPFGSLYKLNNDYCLCASPERFLQKKGNILISQPIKGTSRRDTNTTKDEESKIYLQNSEKEKSENVMVVDLVRNDMSMICEKGSVHVKELFGIYSFPQVHQMISTIQGILCADKNFLQAIAACYPMGSMTGAPKQKVMELIEQYEVTERGLFSGSIGYITPERDFDFNVVIRSVFYNDIKKYLSFYAGSGITFYSEAEKEYDECLSKSEAIMKVLS